MYVCMYVCVCVCLYVGMFICMFSVSIIAICVCLFNHSSTALGHIARRWNSTRVLYEILYPPSFGSASKASILLGQVPPIICLIPTTDKSRKSTKLKEGDNTYLVTKRVSICTLFFVSHSSLFDILLQSILCCERK